MENGIFRLQQKTTMGNNIEELFFFLFLCTLTGHNLGEGIDSILSRGIFAILCLLTVLNLAKVQNWKLYTPRVLMNTIVFWMYYLISMYRNVSTGLMYYQKIIEIIVICVFLCQDTEIARKTDKYLKYILYSTLYMTMWLAIKTPLRVWGSERVGEVLNLNSNTIGIYTSIGALIALYFGENKKAYYVIVIWLSTIALLSGSKKSVIILAVGIIMFSLFRFNGRKGIRNLIIGIALLFILGYLIMETTALYNILGIRIDKMMYQLIGTSISGNIFTADRSSRERLFFIEYGVEMFKNKPIFGYGSNMFRIEMMNIGFAHAAYSHNNYIELLATLGIVGFSIYYYPRFKTMLNGIRLHKIKHDGESFILICLLVSILVTEYFFVGYVSVYTQVIYYIIALKIENEQYSVEQME